MQQIRIQFNGVTEAEKYQQANRTFYENLPVSVYGEAIIDAVI
jgi:hypothetical protein